MGSAPLRGAAEAARANGDKRALAGPDPVHSCAMSNSNRLLLPGRTLLERLRAEREAWSLLAPRPEAGEQGETDPRERDRMQLAWALQYDARAQDGELLRHALEQEIEWREVAPFQGIGETLEILACLVARERRVEDVWLLARAKLANFDTDCGFDREHLVAGGVAATLAYVRGSASSAAEARARVLELLLDEGGGPLFEEEAIAGWHAALERRHPRQPADEPLETWLNRALAVGDLAVARQLLDEWSAGCADRDVDFLGTLAHYFAELGEHVRESDIRTERLHLLSTPFDRAAERCTIAAAERRAGRWQRALDSLDHAALLHRPRPSWRELGLGRNLVLECFELATVSPAPVALAAFTLGEEFAAVTPELPPVALERRAAAEAKLKKS